MRKLIAGVVCAGLLILGAPARAYDNDPAAEAGWAAEATLANLVYTPAKVIVAVLGVPAGALAGLFSGGDVRTAYAFWVPAIGGTYMLTAANFDGTRPIQFWGSDYADRPSRASRENDGSRVYDTIYE